LLTCINLNSDSAINYGNQMSEGNEVQNASTKRSINAREQHIAIQRLNREQNRLDLLIADVGSGKSHSAITVKDQYWINVGDDLRFLKDGKRFLWSDERSGYRHLYLYDLEGKQLAELTKGNWEVSGVQAVDEAKSLVYFTATEKSALERHLYRVALDASGFTPERWIESPEGRFGLAMGLARASLRGV